MAASTPPPILPLDDRSNALKVPIVTLIILSSISVALRLGVSSKTRNSFLLTDHFLWTGHILAVVGAAFHYKTAEVGGGKHAWDSIMTPTNKARYLKYLWMGQLLNVYGMVLIKLSICAYILTLDFSKGYRRVIWLSVFILISFNFVLPSIILLGECEPISKHWDVAGTRAGSCWPARTRVLPGYASATTNILTDIIYTMTPIIYILSVKLPERITWGVCAVFLVGLITTNVSALKLYELKVLAESSDPTYTSVDLIILTVAEVFVGALTAALPPLRKTFEYMLDHVFSNSLITNSKRIRIEHIFKEGGSRLKARITRPKRACDDDSELGILPENHASRAKWVIMKTIEFSVMNEACEPRTIASMKRQEVWE